MDYASYDSNNYEISTVYRYNSLYKNVVTGKNSEHMRTSTHQYGCAIFYVKTGENYVLNYKSSAGFKCVDKDSWNFFGSNHEQHYYAQMILCA